MSAAHHGAAPRSPAAAWRSVVEHFVHPISGALVLAAAGVELAEWVQVAVEHLVHLVEAPGPIGG